MLLTLLMSRMSAWMTGIMICLNGIKECRIVFRRMRKKSLFVIMIKKMSTERTANYTRTDRTAIGHEVVVRYIASITV